MPGRRAYGQFCGLVRALEIVGERWALLIVRDLLVEPKRFTDLRRGLPRIPTNVLSERLKQLEEWGVVRRRLLPRPAGSVVYELTDYGNDLEEAVLKLGLWGARSLTVPAPDEIVTPDSLVVAMRACFRPSAARRLNLRYELRIGPIRLAVRIKDGRLAAAEGPMPDADLVIETGPAIRAMMAGELSPEAAIEHDLVHLTGDPALLTRFVDIFHIPPAPSRNGRQ
jgi:DNA-binding HxlR family transcriptional regulator